MLDFNLRSPGASIHTYELSYWVRDPEEFNALSKKFLNRFSTRTKSGGRIEITDLEQRGIRVSLVSGTKFGSYVYIVINPQRLIADEYCPADIISPNKTALNRAKKALTKELRKAGLPELELYQLSRVDLCANLEGKKNSFVREFLRLLHKQKTSTNMAQNPFYDARLDAKDNRKCRRDYYRISNRNENLVFYDKVRQAKRFELRGVQALPKGVLRIEWQLERGALRELEETFGYKSMELMTYLACHSDELLHQKLSDCFYGGTYYREDELLTRINAAPFKKKVQERMRWYVKAAKRSGEDEAARCLMKKKNWNVKEFHRFRKRFEAIGVQPVPLRKNYKEDHLETPECCLLSEFGEDCNSGVLFEYHLNKTKTESRDDDDFVVLRWKNDKKKNG